VQQDGDGSIVRARVDVADVEEPGVDLAQRTEVAVHEPEPTAARPPKTQILRTEALADAPPHSYACGVRPLPDGTITLLFTDVESSTALLQELGQDFADELQEHRRSLRAAFGEHGGAEVDTQGDSFFVVFPRAGDAVAAAQDAQRALKDRPIRVRMGVHTGEPDRIAEGYVGLDVVKGARIAAAAHGGQVLLSNSTRDLLDTSVPVADLGMHSLRGFADPVHLFQLGSREFPPLATAAATNLPRPAKPLVGRDADIAAVRTLLQEPDARLVTIVGPGGVGKTRLAIEAARELAAEFADGTWFVDLSPISSSRLVLPTIATALGAKGPLDEHLGDRRTLLVLDNLEQVASAAPLLAGLTDTCPGTAILGTSREPLRVAVEQEYALHPLAEAPAVELFEQRAAPRRTAANRADVAEICRRLDGLPLAIELAAARTKLLDPAALLARLDRRLPLLTTTSRDAPERQRTLQATIEWSYDLLDDAEKRLFARLAIFVSGFTLEAAEAVCDADLDVLASLVDKSLVRESEWRLGLLDTIREFAAAKLADSGEAAELRRRHAEYYVRFVEQLEAGLTGGEQTERLEELEQEHENLHAALDELLATHATDQVLRLASALAIFWYVRGFYAEGVDWLERALASPNAADSPVYAKALWGAGMLAVLTGDPVGGGKRLEQGRELARAVDDRQTVARSLTMLGLLAFFGNDLDQACALLEQGVEAAREAGDLWCLADVLGTLGSIYPLHGEPDAGEQAGSEGLRIARANHDAHGIRMSLFGLALTESRRGNAERTRELGSEGLSLSRAMGDPWFTSYFLWLVSRASLALGEVDHARVEAEESYAVAKKLGVDLLTVCALDALGRIAHAEGDDEAAERHIAEALALAAAGAVPKSYEAGVFGSRAQFALERGDYGRARASAEQSLALAREVGDAVIAEVAAKLLEAVESAEV
jgi:predicted ATPase/class 3 adenylate cyclase